MKHYIYTSKYGSTYEDCYFDTGYYENGNIAFYIMSQSEGPIIVPTVNPGIKLPPDRIAIKNYSENEGIIDYLISLDMIEHDPVQLIQSGWVEIPIHKLTPTGKEILGIED